ncbi:MAG TPA: TIGR02206 family membrane protein [Anaerolineales bacterium]|nr:TIGR02206 family membrane protein [Anaerolineales bacterium]
MDQFFARDFHGPAFELFGFPHIITLATLLALNLILIQTKHAREDQKKTIRWALALTLVVNETAWHIWNVAVGRWTIQSMLPLHLCSLLVWIGALMLVTMNYRMYEFMYLLGIGGAIQALATPDLGIYGFPHFRFFQTFISHGLIITSAIFMTVVEGFRPTWKSLLRVAFWTNVYVVIVYFINNAIGSNYLMINAKPNTPSLLDLLPPWPIYILYMEIIGLITVFLLYLPFAVQDLRSQTGGSNNI